MQPAACGPRRPDHRNAGLSPPRTTGRRLYPAGSWRGPHWRDRPAQTRCRTAGFLHALLLPAHLVISTGAPDLIRGGAEKSLGIISLTMPGPALPPPVRWKQARVARSSLPPQLRWCRPRRPQSDPASPDPDPGGAGGAGRARLYYFFKPQHNVPPRTERSGVPGTRVASAGRAERPWSPALPPVGRGGTNN